NIMRDTGITLKNLYSRFIDSESGGLVDIGELLKAKQGSALDGMAIVGEVPARILCAFNRINGLAVYHLFLMEPEAGGSLSRFTGFKPGFTIRHPCQSDPWIVANKQPLAICVFGF